MDQTHTLTNDGWSAGSQIQFGLRNPPRKRKPDTIIFDDEFPLSLHFQQLHQYLLRAAMLAHVNQRFLGDSREFATNWLGKQYLLVVNQEPCGDPGLPLKALD